MKIRNTYIYIVLLFSFSFSGCGQNKSVNEPEKKQLIETLSTEAFKKKVFDYRVSNEWKYAGSKPCVIDFYADWCGPCRKLAPVVEELAREYEGRVIFYKVNIDKEKEIASVFNVQGIPMLFFVPKKGSPSVLRGLYPKEEIRNAINTQLLK